MGVSFANPRRGAILGDAPRGVPGRARAVGSRDSRCGWFSSRRPAGHTAHSKRLTRNPQLIQGRKGATGPGSEKPFTRVRYLIYGHRQPFSVGSWACPATFGYRYQIVLDRQPKSVVKSFSTIKWAKWGMNRSQGRVSVNETTTKPTLRRSR